MRLKLIRLLACTGLLAAALSATWGPEERITDNRLDNVTYYTNGHKLVFGAGGVGHYVWWDEDGKAVYYKRFYPDDGWSKELQLCKQSSTPSIALDSDGSTVHVVWSARKRVGSVNYYHIFYQKCTPGSSGNGGWDPEPTDLCSNISGRLHYNPSIACGPDGQVVVTWEECWDSSGWVYSIGFREYTGGSWEDAGLIEEPDAFTRYNPSIATDSDGNVFVAYYGAKRPPDFPGSPVGNYVWANRRLDGTWLGWECVPPIDAAGNLLDGCAVPDIDVDPTTGYPHVVCEGLLNASSWTYHTCRTPGGWELPECVSYEETPSASCIDQTPSLSFGNDGSAHVVWSKETPTQGIYYNVLVPSGTWNVPVPIATGYPCHSPSITVGADGSLHAVWTRYDAGAKYPYQLYGSTASGSFAAGSQTGRSGASAPGLALDVSPNPASRGMKVSYCLPAAGNVSLKLYDVSGSVAQTLASGNSTPGRHTASLSGLGLTPGAYFLKLETDFGSLTRKVVSE